MTQISGSENTRKLVFGRYDSIECGGELLCGLLRTRTAEREPARQELALIAVERLQCDLTDHHFPQPGVLDREVVRPSGFSGEVRGGRLMMGAYSDEGLPIGAEMVFAGIDGQVEVGIAMIRSYPGSVQPNARDWQGTRLELRVIFHEIDHSLAGLRLGGRVLGLVRLDIELDVDCPAA